MHRQVPIGATRHTTGIFGYVLFAAIKAFNRSVILVVLSCVVLVGGSIGALAQQTSQTATNSLTDTNLPVRCMRNLKQIYLDYANWAQRHEGKFPFNVSTNAGGSRELSFHGDDCLEKHPATQFRSLASGLVGYDYGTFTPKILVCPADTNRTAASDFRELQSSNVTYELFCCTNNLGDTPPGVLLHCTIHDWTVLTDGSIYRVPGETVSTQRPNLARADDLVGIWKSDTNHGTVWQTNRLDGFQTVEFLKDHSFRVADVLAVNGAAKTNVAYSGTYVMTATNRVTLKLLTAEGATVYKPLTLSGTVIGDELELPKLIPSVVAEVRKYRRVKDQ